MKTVLIALTSFAGLMILLAAFEFGIDDELVWISKPGLAVRDGTG